MRIDEAIETLLSISAQEHLCYFPHLNNAVKLGIEALKLVKDKRGYPEYIIPRLLPGETDA